MFTELPTELIEPILSDSELSFKTQHALLHSCRRLYWLLKPGVYRKIQLNFDDCTPEAIERSSRRLVQLCRTLYRSSSAASMVQELDIQGSKPLSVLPQLWSEVGYTDWLPRKKKWEGTFRWWKTQLVKGNPDVLVAVIISVVRNMRVLRLGFDIWSRSPFLSVVLEFPKNLQYVEFLAPSPRAGWDWDAHTDIFKCTNAPVRYDMKQLRALLNLPQIRNLTCVVAEIGGILARSFKDISCTDMKRMVFAKSELQQKSLGQVLRATPLLKELIYDNWINVNTPEILPCYFESDQMDTALWRLRRELRTLHISVTFYSHRGTNVARGTHWGINGTIQSLVRFSQLTELKIPMVILLGWQASGSQIRLNNVLPFSLQRLILRVDEFDGFESYDWTRADIMDRVWTFINHVRIDNMKRLRYNRRPWDLRVVELELPDLSSPDDLDVQNGLVSECLEAGIDIVIK